MLYVHGQDVGVTKQLCDVTMKDSNDGFVEAMLKMLFAVFLQKWFSYYIFSKWEFEHHQLPYLNPS